MGKDHSYRKGELLDSRFEMKQMIGNGAFAELYVCYDHELKQKCALKVEIAEKGLSDKWIEEARIHQLLSSKGIGVPRLICFDKASQAAKMYSVMELLGPDLSLVRKMAPDHKLSMRTVGFLGKQALKTMEKMHDESVIHRDLKPQNFLLGLEDPMKLYMCDFGLSCMYAKDDDESAKLRHKLIGRKPDQNCPFRGTAAYSSLTSQIGVEQTKRDDLQALLWVMLDLLVGGLPWRKLGIPDKAKRKEIIVSQKRHFLAICKDLEEEGRVRVCNDLDAKHTWKSVGFKGIWDPTPHDVDADYDTVFTGPFGENREPVQPRDIAMEQLVESIPSPIIRYCLGFLKLEWHWHPPYAFFYRCFEELEHLGDEADFKEYFEASSVLEGIAKEMYGEQLPKNFEVKEGSKKSDEKEKWSQVQSSEMRGSRVEASRASSWYTSCPAQSMIGEKRLTERSSNRLSTGLNMKILEKDPLEILSPAETKPEKSFLRKSVVGKQHSLETSRQDSVKLPRISKMSKA